MAPVELHNQLPLTDAAAMTTVEAREAVHNILSQKDDRLIVIVGPCSIHDPKAAYEYAEKLRVLKEELKSSLHRDDTVQLLRDLSTAVNKRRTANKVAKY